MDKSREQFEAWAEEVGALPWGKLEKQRIPSGGYSIQIYTYMWNAWQASREAIEVDLSQVHLLMCDEKDVVETLKSLGLKVKP